MSDEDRAISRTWRAYRTVHEMVYDRGYEVARAQREMSLEEFKNQKVNGSNIVRSSLTFQVSKRDDDNDHLLCFFPDDESLGIKPIKTICEQMVTQGVTKAIVVYVKNITPSANKVVQEMAPKYQIELFQEGDLLVNITKHVLVPKHEVMSNEEKKTLLARYRLKESQLPRIQPNDAVAKYYGLKRGQVVRIIRPSETAGKYVTYRFCF